MIQKIAAQDRYHLESDWLSAYWLFSFDRYYNPNNMAFGPLRVFNHDTIKGGAGFPTHPHREMEIVTYVLQGALAHQDSMGGKGLIRPGEVQRMTAGTGVAHSEFNASETDVTKLLQMWVLPERAGLTPSYEQKQFTAEERTGKLLPIASGQDYPGAVKVHQDVTFYVSRLQASDTVAHSFTGTRRVFLYVIEGAVKINGEPFNAGDQARLVNEPSLALEATTDSEIILIDLP
ncbi:MAG TPA: pirin family protein [Blastocatellia bacterium]|nr:pirin family protein [Blastocatellia bacterium]